MAARLNLHIPDAPVLVRLVDDGTEARLGRDTGCDIVLAHPSVSRQHAWIGQETNGTWTIRDLGSKNGTRINGERITSAGLEHGRWFSIADVYVEFEIVPASVASQHAARVATRRQQSAAWAAAFRPGGDIQALLTQLLTGMVQVAECERGFVISADAQGRMRVAACVGLAPEQLRAAAFSGSRSAIDRVIELRRPVYLSDRRDRAWLQDQASIVGQGIRALACLPLLHEEELLGLAYADTADVERVFTDLDAQLLEAMVEHASSALAASRLASQLDALAAWVGGNAAGTEAPLWKPPE